MTVDTTTARAALTQLSEDEILFRDSVAEFAAESVNVPYRLNRNTVDISASHSLQVTWVWKNFQAPGGCDHVGARMLDARSG